MIYAPRKQRTIARPATVGGFGYWSGRDVRVEFRPARPATGVVFVRADLPRPVRIAAVVQNRVEAPRRTNLVHDGASVEMVEHILAAVAGLRIYNCEVWVDQAEMPGCDGSSQDFVVALDSAGIVVQDATREALIITSVTRLGDDDCWIEARPSNSPQLIARYNLDYGARSIGHQTLRLDVTPQSFRRELASARTFMLKQEADWLLAQGLGARATLRDLLVFDDQGVVGNSLRFQDECVRHKILDLVGDLALAGCDLVGEFVAHKSGHRLNAEMVRSLLAADQVAGDRRRSA